MKAVRCYEIHWIDSWMLNGCISRVTDLERALSCIQEVGGSILDVKVVLNERS